jgi:uncharacterized protein (DUF58 family)
MIPKEIFQKVRQIEITTSRLVTEVFAGQYHSIFKGQGMEFDEVREYQLGDDVRFIDWNVTARTGKAYVKKFVEERELTVMILIDASPSCHFATVNQLKNHLSAEIASVLALSAVGNNDKVGLIIFTDQIEKFIPPRKGRQHVLRVIREILYFQPTGKATDIAGALEYLQKVMNRKSICFILSDFYQPGIHAEGPRRYDFQKKLTIGHKRHDLIAVTLNDPTEKELPDCGLLNFVDPETGRRALVDSSDQIFREQYKRFNLHRLAQRERMFRSVGIDHVAIDTDQPYAPSLVKFFLKRRRKMH